MRKVVARAAGLILPGLIISLVAHQSGGTSSKSAQMTDPNAVFPKVALKQIPGYSLTLPQALQAMLKALRSSEGPPLELSVTLPATSPRPVSPLASVLAPYDRI